MKRTQEERRFRRHLRNHSQRGGWCAVCGETFKLGQGVEWFDPENVSRGTMFFLVCRGCALTSFAPTLTRLHRRIWEKRHEKQATTTKHEKRSEPIFR